MCRWLGLILGTRLWYAFWDADELDDVAFDRRLDAVLREVGERGKPVLAEAVPPSLHEPTPAPALEAPAPAAPALAQAPAPAPAPATAAPAPAHALIPALAPARAMVRAPDQTTFSPTLHRTMPSVVEVERPSGGSSVTEGSLGELAAFMEKQQCLLMEREDKMEAKLESQRLEAKAERAALEAKVESQRVTLEARMEEMKLASNRERRDNQVRGRRHFQLAFKRGNSNFTNAGSGQT